MELKHLFIFLYGGALDTHPLELTMDEAREQALLLAKRMEANLGHSEIGITVQCYNERLCQWESLFTIYADGREQRHGPSS